MRQYKFKFNKKSILITVDINLKVKNQTGWLSEALQAVEQILESPTFTDEDKKNILRLKIYSIYKMLQPLN